MAKKASQSVKDRLLQYKKTARRRSFFDDLSDEAKSFLLEVRELHRSNELDLKWSELHEACRNEFPNDPWPLGVQTLSIWVQEA